MELSNRLVDIIAKAQKKFPYLHVQVTSDLLDSPVTYRSPLTKEHFHSASVGKLATCFAMIKLIEQGAISLDSLITSVIDSSLLTNLFVYKGIDYREHVTIRHLLSHTSGVNDYFEGITRDKKSLIDQIINDPSHRYTPIELIQITAKNQDAVGKPGEKFLYSDTGFVLLAVIMENVTKMAFHKILQDYVLTPLKMTQTGLLYYDDRAELRDLSPVIVKKVDVNSFQSLSVDYAGGGLSTTLDDLTLLVKALTTHFISPALKASMTEFNRYFQAGMYYGLGVMELRFEKLFFLLKGLPHLQGHLGVLGVHAWIDPLTYDTYVINISNMDQLVASFNLLISLVMEVHKARRKESSK